MFALQLTVSNGAGFRDDYHSWNENDRVSSMGKVMPFYANDKSVHHIFFDDNIKEDDLYLVGPFDLDAGKCAYHLYQVQ